MFKKYPVQNTFIGDKKQAQFEHTSYIGRKNGLMLKDGECLSEA